MLKCKIHCKSTPGNAQGSLNTESYLSNQKMKARCDFKISTKISMVTFLYFSSVSSKSLPGYRSDLQLHLHLHTYWTYIFTFTFTFTRSFGSFYKKKTLKIEREQYRILLKRPHNGSPYFILISRPIIALQSLKNWTLGSVQADMARLKLQVFLNICF